LIENFPVRTIKRNIIFCLKKVYLDEPQQEKIYQERRMRSQGSSEVNAEQVSSAKQGNFRDKLLSSQNINSGEVDCEHLAACSLSK